MGTTFTVQLTFARDDQARQDETDASVPTDSIRGAHVLLVEDNDLNMEIAEFMLTNEGVNVVKAVNGQQAVERFEASMPGDIDVILMDVMMPVMDGLQSAAMIRRLNHPRAAGIPIIAMTANAFSEDIKKSAAAGMNDHLTKPVDPDHLCEVLAAHCRGV